MHVNLCMNANAFQGALITDVHAIMLELTLCCSMLRNNLRQPQTILVCRP